MPLFESSQQRRAQECEMKAQDRLPPGQSLTLKWPVLHEGDVPIFDPQTWDFCIGGLIEKPLRFSYAEFMALPKVEVNADFHCVTRWSKFDNCWEGVAFKKVVKPVLPRPEAHYVMVQGENGYTANAPLNDLMRPEVVLAFKHNGENLTPEHGWPLRLIVPHLYAWKSVKWVRGLEFMERDRPGFWEQNGYHIYGDPWKEQRFSSK
jgi:DMSO/TMAO reductase YedYZ molybdopterin-dependent catalytic subunit